eukprot:CAMPEP_0117427224 /NCGR_PEP_ID=MMETSP0758-20121206/7126_1 /TAXON_ID=63605 /ORGANISM="Percolomonas cosmopolitus, Strain AE-1 (ATCC 50343)" /LENGTH=403 /DNA_ID=CAMNT_0005212755 /DNA_START=67 /DNA_END=1278 /DNA_ORIENTATION=-
MSKQQQKWVGLTNMKQLNENNLGRMSVRNYATEIPLPSLADSITSGEVDELFIEVDMFVPKDAIIMKLSTDKTFMDIPMAKSGVIKSLSIEVGDEVSVGDVIFEIEECESAPEGVKVYEGEGGEEEEVAAAPKEETKKEEKKETKKVEEKKTKSAPSSAPKRTGGEGGETRVPMSKMRQRIAQRLKDSQNEYALLTTFNEIDMTGAIEMRNKHKDAFLKKHGVKLGFMGIFMKASAMALQELPDINAVIDGTDVVYRDYVDISVAVSTPNGLVVPVVRNVEQLSIAEIELEIGRLAKKAREGTLSIPEMTGGTFTISNGGVYGSLMGTPIVNPPQSAILGMHATKKRAWVVENPETGEDELAIRPVMFTALTYDHRLIDGRGAVTYLKRVGELVAEPEKMLLF